MMTNVCIYLGSSRLLVHKTILFKFHILSVGQREYEVSEREKVTCVKLKQKAKQQSINKSRHQNLPRGTISFYLFLTITFCSCVINGGG